MKYTKDCIITIISKKKYAKEVSIEKEQFDTLDEAWKWYDSKLSTCASGAYHEKITYNFIFHFKGGIIRENTIK